MTDFRNLYIPLPSLNPRVLIPAQGSYQAFSYAPLLYSPASWKGKLSRFLFRGMAFLNFAKLLTGKTAVPAQVCAPEISVKPIFSAHVLEALKEQWLSILGLGDVEMIFSLGTPNRFRKVTALILGGKGRPVAVGKIGCTAEAAHLIRHEHEALSHLTKIPFTTCLVPVPLGLGEFDDITWSLQTPLSKGSLSPNTIRKSHLAFLRELAARGTITGPLSRASFWSRMRLFAKQNRFDIEGYSADDTVFLRRLATESGDFLDSMEEVNWPLVSAHGDFTPWNIRMTGKAVSVYDWEYYISRAPAGWDVLRFVFMTQYLLKKQSFRELYRVFLDQQSLFDPVSQWEQTTGVNIPDRRTLVTLFLLDIISNASRLPEH